MGIALLIGVPALVGVGAIIGGIRLLATRGAATDEAGARALRTMLGVLLLLIAAGIGTCFGIVYQM